LPVTIIRIAGFRRRSPASRLRVWWSDGDVAG
jgi:hypothetical protein